LKRYDNNNEIVQGLKNKPRSGRPSDLSEEKLLEIREELSENPSGWKVKQIMNMIYDKTDVRYHEVHVNAASKEEKEQFKKRRER
jgi:putative transposase